MCFQLKKLEEDELELRRHMEHTHEIQACNPTPPPLPNSESFTLLCTSPRSTLRSIDRPQILQLDQRIATIEESVSKERDHAKSRAEEASQKMSNIMNRYEAELDAEAASRIDARINKSQRLSSEEQDRREGYWSILEHYYHIWTYNPRFYSLYRYWSILEQLLPYMDI